MVNNLLLILMTGLILAGHSNISLAKANFLIQRNHEEIIQNAVLKNKSKQYSVDLNLNLSKNFNDIYTDITSKDSDTVNNRIDSLIGKPLRSTAYLGFKIPSFINLGYFHSYQMFALAQNPVFPNVDISLSSSHNFWGRYQFSPIKDLGLDIAPVIGFKKTIRETKGAAAIINDGVNLNLKDQNSDFTQSLNLNLKYSFNILDIEIENYNYFLEENSLYSSFLKLTSYYQYQSHKLSFSGRYRVAQPFYTANEKRIDFITDWNWSNKIKFQLTLAETKFLNPEIEVKLFGFEASLSYNKTSLDNLQQQISENYNLRLAYRF